MPDDGAPPQRCPSCPCRGAEKVSLVAIRPSGSVARPRRRRSAVGRGWKAGLVACAHELPGDQYIWVPDPVENVRTRRAPQLLRDSPWLRFVRSYPPPAESRACAYARACTPTTQLTGALRLRPHSSAPLPRARRQHRQAPASNGAQFHRRPIRFAAKILVTYTSSIRTPLRNGRGNVQILD